MAFGGVALKSVSMFLRIIEFCCAAVILALFSYFLAELSDHGLGIATYIKAVEGISGAAILYTAFAILLVCCLGGRTFFAFLGMILDIAFCGAFIYIAWATRGGAGSCSGYVNTPLGSGTVGTDSLPTGNGGNVSMPSLQEACRMTTATFAVAIIALFLFPISALMEWALARHHQHEKRYGPSPSNGYTSGSPKRRWWRRRGSDKLTEKHPDALPAHVTPADATRTSYATDASAASAHPLYQSTPAHTGAYDPLAAPASRTNVTSTYSTTTAGTHGAMPEHPRMEPNEPIGNPYANPYGNGHNQTKTQDYAANF